MHIAELHTLIYLDRDGRICSRTVDEDGRVSRRTGRVRIKELHAMDIEMACVRAEIGGKGELSDTERGDGGFGSTTATPPHVSEATILFYKNRSGQTCFRYRDDDGGDVRGQLSTVGRGAIRNLLSAAVERVEAGGKGE